MTVMSSANRHSNCGAVYRLNMVLFYVACLWLQDLRGSVCPRTKVVTIHQNPFNSIRLMGWILFPAPSLHREIINPVQNIMGGSDCSAILPCFELYPP